MPLRLEQIRNPRKLGLGEQLNPSAARGAIGNRRLHGLANRFRRSVNQSQQDVAKRIVRQTSRRTHGFVWLRRRFGPRRQRRAVCGFAQGSRKCPRLVRGLLDEHLEQTYR